MKKTFILTLLVFSIFTVNKAYSQTDDDFEKFKNEYNQGLKDLGDDYRKFVEKSDKEFAEYLKNDWEQFKLFKEMKIESLPGPETIPVYKQIINIEPVRRITPKQITGNTLSEPVEMIPRTAIPIEEKPIGVKYKALDFKFFGAPVGFTIPLKMCEKFNTQVSEQSISEYWEKLSNTEYNSVVVDLLKIKNTLNLNDFALYSLIASVTKQTITEDNGSRLLTWFLLTKLGYKIKVGYYNNKIFLLVPSVNQLYGYNYYVFDGLKYYVFEGETDEIFTYSKDYPEANQIMNFNLYSTPNFPVDTLSRNIAFDYNSKNYSLKVLYNKNLIDFYNTYPQCNISLYFDAGISELTKESLAKGLWPILRNQTQKDAAAMMLKMVQTSFAYKTDQEQFGKEKYFFPEEILYYPAADCEDRSVFFAYIINEFLQLPVISLCYPQHVSTAVDFKKEIYGDFIEYKGCKYTICDPTYINAPIGATMPEYKKSKLSVIVPDKRNTTEDQPEYVWEKIYKAGGLKTGISGDVLYFKDSSYVITGFFNDSLKLGDKIYRTDSASTGVFLSAYDKGNNFIWVKTFSSDSWLSPQGIAHDNQNNIYFTGEFGGTIKYDKKKIKAFSASDQFVVKLSANGEIEWINSLNLDTVTRPKPFAFQILLSESGQIQGFTYIQEYTYDENIAIYCNENNSIVVSSERGSSEAKYKFTPEFGSSGSFELVDAWKKLTDEYISLHYNKSIAGFFALMETLENTNLDLTGKEILASLNTLSPKFKENYKGFYLSLQLLTRLSSRNGIVTFYTSNGQVIKCGPISIVSGAQAQMRDYKSGNKQIKALKGIYFDTFFRSLNVNYIKFFKVNGDLMIDYSSDHYQKVVNTERDILKQ